MLRGLWLWFVLRVASLYAFSCAVAGGFSLVVAFRSSWDGQVLRGWCGLRLLGALRGLLWVVAVCCGFWGFAIWTDCVFRSCVGLV